MKVLPGTYSTPLGKLVVAQLSDEGTVSVETGEHDPIVVWEFTPEGKFKRFRISFPGTQREGEESQVIFACQHIEPGYSGQAYSVQGGVRDFVSVVCSQCIIIKGEVASGRKLNILPVELWRQIRKEMVVIPIVIGGGEE